MQHQNVYQRGQRVVTHRHIRGHIHTIPMGWSGTVERERDNGVGSTLVYVLWDMNGEVWPVLREDVMEDQ